MWRISRNRELHRFYVAETGSFHLGRRVPRNYPCQSVYDIFDHSRRGKVLRRSGRSIVLFASAAAEIGIPNHEAIAAAKGGVISIARSAAATYAAQEIRVNVISPGLVRTSLTKQIWSNPAAATASTEMHALGRLGESQDLVGVAVWLLDPSNSWITGQVIGVDGGLSSLLPRRRQPT